MSRTALVAAVVLGTLMLLYGPRLAAGSPGIVRDVNGDGLADVAVVSDSRGLPGGLAAVVFGTAASAPVALDALGPRGFPIRSASLFGAEVAGDVDGDGLADLLVSGARGMSVVFGKRDIAAVDVDTPGSGTVRLPYADAMPVGDIDGDGRADIVGMGRYGRRLHVTSGQPDRDRFAYAGALIVRVKTPDLFLLSAGSAGDANGDGIGDVVLSLYRDVACGDSGGEGTSCGARGFVIFGRRDLRSLAIVGRDRRGCRLRGGGRRPGYGIRPLIGDAVVPAGDVDGDGRDDVIVSGHDGPAVLVYGKRGIQTAAVPRRQAASLVRPAYEDGTAAGVGDLNGDGLSDVVADTDLPGRGLSNAALAVAFGRSRRKPTDPLVGRYTVALPRNAVPDGLMATGDLNGDTLGDFMVAFWPPQGGRRRTFVVFSKLDRDPQILTSLGAGGFEIR